MTLHSGLRIAYEPSGVQLLQAAFYCDECSYMSIATMPSPDGAFGPVGSTDELERGEPVWYPNFGRGKEYPDVPQHISEVASEAHVCHSVGAYRAAVLLARAVIEAAAKHHGISTGNLLVKIDAMHAAELIGRVVKEGAHEVRHFGNDMAHGDFGVAVDSSESDEVLMFMGNVLHNAFQQEAQVLRVRAAREARKVAVAEN